MSKGRSLLVLLLVLWLGDIGLAKTVYMDLNGLKIGVDDNTGGLVELSCPGSEDIIKTTPEQSGLVDLAYPVESYGPMRLATRFSKGNVIKKKDELIITWDRLGPSNTYYKIPEGKVTAQATIKAAANGKSLILTCKIENHSNVPVRQVIFPDIHGMQPFAGMEDTKIKISKHMDTPFSGPVRQPHTASFYAKGIGWTTYDKSDETSQELDRVYLLGHQRGIGFFHKGRGNSCDRIFTHRKEISPETLRLLFEHQDNIEPGETWQSDEYWITPYQGSMVNALPSVRELHMNGLEILINEDTGNIVRMFHSPSSTLLLDCEAVPSGLVEVGIAKTKHDEPMILSSMFSAVEINEVNDGLDLIWDELCSLKPIDPMVEGKIAARVAIRSANDHRSVIMSCFIENNTNKLVHLVRFPDLHGLRMIEDINATRVRLARDSYQPFKIWDWTEKPNVLTWIDYGGYSSGISIFQKKWNRGFSEVHPSIMTFREKQTPDSLRLAFGHRTVYYPLVNAGESWQSGEFWLTPHQGGWAKGIEVFRDYVQKVRYLRELPQHIREGMGYRTVWMSQTADTNPETVAFKYTDLPEIAMNAKNHGLYEIVPWFWCSTFDLPIVTRPELGTEEEFIQGVFQAREMGVNISPFISINIVRNELAEKYGAVPSSASWTYHPELIPNFRAYYANWNKGARLGGGTKNIDPVWLQDVENTLDDWIDKGVPSFCWDLWYTHPELLEMVHRVRAKATATYPESVFCGEIHSFEQDDEVLDYCWNWANYHDNNPITTVHPYPRMNCNVESSALVVRMAFCDNLFMNVMPRKPDQPNGTALIEEGSELSIALKECARLRKQFLDYFIKGTLIGDSVLSSPSNGFVRGYQLGESLLVFVVNRDNKPQQISICSNLGIWLPKIKEYLITCYNSSGNPGKTFSLNDPHWEYTTEELTPSALMIFEIKEK